ncbi:MAG: FAD-binding oxidoreductase, partial [Nocardioidaceae bacterium]|nr:FAD-binding oxidoreductase [Nocardioidaceae bacterium]
MAEDSGEFRSLAVKAVAAELGESGRAGMISEAALHRLTMAHDASHYLLIPQAVATPKDLNDVASLLASCHRHGLPLTFRSGGSSLSGQAGTERLLVDTRKSFRSIEVHDSGRRVSALPGVTIGQVNARLASFGTRLGPDPASEIACTIGGLVSNNASGMACGTEFNTYHTLESAVLVLPSGTVINTALPDSDAMLRASEPELHRTLAQLRDRVRGNPDSLRRIRELFAIKNTMGYGLNAFSDHDRPVDILLRLVVGSEGTLAFVARATFRTVARLPHVSTSVLIFPTLSEATAALTSVRGTGPAVVELLDSTSLAVCQRSPRARDQLGGLEVDEHAALLIEHREHTAEEVALRSEEMTELVTGMDLAQPYAAARTASARADLWHLRKGLYAMVASARPAGTSALLEDVAVPPERMLDLCTDLSGLFTEHSYSDAVIFGHAKDGNIHFLLNEQFDDPAALRRYADFTADMVDLVLGLGGTLKAEHGTGRVMAPYVRRQYGDELYDVMHRLKTACDPRTVLNPGVILNDDPRAHLRHLKTTPTVEEEVDACVECGFCEPVCPSRNLTLTPRQRIVLRRELTALREAGLGAEADALERESRYEAVDTCAADGMCATACPVDIDTGALVRRQRAQSTGPGADRLGRVAAKQWSSVSKAGSRALDIAATVPRLSIAASTVARAMAGHERVPRYGRDLPRGGHRRASRDSPEPQIVLFSSCLGAIMGPSDAATGGVGSALLELCERAGIGVRIPAGIDGLCCTMPFTSKGLVAGAEEMANRVAGSLKEASDGGRLPVVSDAASCTEGLEHLRTAIPEVRVVDAVHWGAEVLVPALKQAGYLRQPLLGSMALHPTCATRRAGLDADLEAIA